MKSSAKTVSANLYKVSGITENGHNRALMIVSRNPQDAIKTAVAEFYVEHVMEVSEIEQVWTPRVWPTLSL
jgi:hypothetical protein